MGKQYVSTASASKAHVLDITGVVVTSAYSISVSSDGYACFFDNKIDNPALAATKKLVNKLGIHHVAVYENIMPGLQKKVVVLAYGCFDGAVKLYTFTNDDLATYKEVDTGKTLNSGYWCVAFYKHPELKQDSFVATRADGATDVFSLEIAGEHAAVSIELAGSIPAGTTFPTSLAVSPSTDRKVAVGYASGDVLLYDLDLFKPIYTFHSTDLQSTNTTGLIPRVVAFSPGGSLLAVARDNQLAGCITLYDVNYGENIGLLTTPSHSTKTVIGGFAHEGWVLGLSFDTEGTHLALCGFDKAVRVWNLETREREATINISVTDLEDPLGDAEVDASIASGVQFIAKGVRGGAGGDTNEGLCVVSFDRGVRWYREAGGV